MKALMLIPLLGILSVGCEEQRPAEKLEEPARAEQAAPATAPEQARGDAANPHDGRRILAWVNEAPVYDEEIDFFLETRLSLLPFQTDDEAMREKVLESLVASRAMAQVAERELTERQREKLSMETAFYREEQLAKRYLEKHAQPIPVSREMVEEYYASHLEEFGQRTLKEIEWLSTVEGLTPDRREALLPRFQSLDADADWERTAADANREGRVVDYKRGFFSSGILDPRLGAVVDATAVDEASGLQMVDGRLHRIRVLATKLQPARPLSSVAKEIRKRLAPIAMRESVQKASETVTAQVEVRFSETVNIE